MAYALDLDPRDDLRSSKPQARLAENALTMTFRGNRAGVSYSVQTSTDLVGWTSSGVYMSDADAEGSRTASIGMNGANARFLRLLVAEFAE